MTAARIPILDRIGTGVRNPDDVRARGTICLGEVLTELDRADEKFPRPFINLAEGRETLAEEFAELTQEVRKNPSARDPKAVRREAIQVAAMALRFIRDCCPKEE